MSSFLRTFNNLIGILMSIMYFYQMVYVGVALYARWKKTRVAYGEQVPSEPETHRFAVLIPARNEEKVIAQLIDSLKAQDYPADMIDLFVVADNCTDDTARVAREAGAQVLVRHNRQRVGKGYVLDYALKEIFAQRDKGYDAFVVFDADNLVDKGFFRAMNRSFSQGNRIITSYRNSKNFSSSWVSSASALWYLRESRYLSGARSALGSSCLVSGTGFLVAREILEKAGGWDYHLLTEDIEFSVDSVLKGERIAFCEDAVIYDEQPIRFSQSWRQRLRWAKGFYQVFRQYGRELAQKLLICPMEEKLSCYDLLMTIQPAMLVTVLGLIVNLCALIGGALAADRALIGYAGQTLAGTAGSFYMMFFLYGALALITERHMYSATPAEKLRCLLSFPIFMASYVPMSVQALFCEVEWKPIAHTCGDSVAKMHTPRSGH